MTLRARTPLDWTSRLLAAGIAASILATGWLGYRAVSGWRESARQLADQRAGEWADRLATVLSRDMLGVQSTVLASAQWDQFMLDPPYDVRLLAAAAFARYPYPESFFAWRGTPRADAVVFLNRSDRRPGWMSGVSPRDPFPVVAEYEPEVARVMLDRIAEDLARRRRFSIFDVTLGGVRYQIVARLLYRDALRERPEGVFGFTVNLPWVREHYFPEVVRQVARMAAPGTTLPLGVLDGDAEVVAGPADGVLPEPSRRREFPLMFFDPRIITVQPPEDLSRETWAVVAGAGGDPVLGDAITGGNRTLVLAAMAAAVLALGLVLTARATQARSNLAHLRSEFVATVTHELKTPIATIRAAADTMARGRVSHPDALRDYAQLLVQESKRLTRLVDNLLAYSRITDVTEAYAFAALDVAPLIDEVLAGFRSALDGAGFTVRVDIPPDLPPVRGDRTACLLMFDNLIDNAIRYSPAARSLEIRARPAPPRVAIEVSDRGMGIPASELPHVSRRFFRGTRAGSGGSGLGLAIVSRIARDHGGDILISSDVGTGTTVRVALPAAEVRDEEAHPDR